MSTKVMQKTSIKIDGMFCPHCELTIGRALGSLEGMEHVDVNYRKGQADVEYDQRKTSLTEMQQAIEAEGYEIRKSSVNMQAVSILIIVVSLYAIARALGWTSVFNMFPTVETGMTLGMLFLTGLLTSIHCIAMCGGINLSQSAASARAEGGSGMPNFLYNLGRVVSYTITGAICGAIGQTIGFSGALKGILPVIIGVFMLLMGLNMLGLFRNMGRLGLKMPNFIYKWTAGVVRGRSSFVIGLVNGLMPCGPLQSMQIYALGTGSVIMGAMSMFMFSLGTTPLMFSFGFLAGKLNRNHRKYMLAVSSVIICIMGLNMILDGLTVSGAALPTVNRSQSQMAMLEEGRQTIRTEIDYGNYPEITVRSGIPVEWNIYVPEGKLNGCNGEILIPEYDLDIRLQEGDNIVTFTPDEPGTVAYSCWMGMIKSSITVEE